MKVLTSHYIPIMYEPRPINIMVDLETMGNGASAPIVAIGAVVFNPYTGELGDNFQTVVALNSSAWYGKMDASTVNWWLQQSEEARNIFLPDTPKVSLKDALIQFNQWLSSLGRQNDLHVWGNGVGFDNTILNHAYSAARVKPGFFWWNDTDVRTVVKIGKEVLGIEPKRTIRREGVYHNALDDAKFQAEYVSEIWMKLTR